jgi:hypothetical protein
MSPEIERGFGTGLRAQLAKRRELAESPEAEESAPVAVSEAPAPEHTQVLMQAPIDEVELVKSELQAALAREQELRAALAQQAQAHELGLAADRDLAERAAEVEHQAEQVAAAEDPRVRARLSFVAGDMFADVPAGDLYILKAIVHDWDDARCVRVLRNCRARMRNDGRILCVDSVLPPLGDTGCASAKLLDMLMLVSLPGKERTETEWRALYDAAGLRVLAVTLVNPRSGQSIIEGAPRG